MLRLPAAFYAISGAQVQQAAAGICYSLLPRTASNLKLHTCHATSEAAAGSRLSWSGYRAYSASSMPANAMDLIKELRKISGAPIADVKVSRVLVSCRVLKQTSGQQQHATAAPNIPRLTAYKRRYITMAQQQI